MFKKLARASRGFTLIEILVVIGIIAILATIVIIAINPARQFGQARNTQRTANVETILNAVGQYIADNKGNLPGSITTSALEIKKTGGADLCSDIVPTYVSSLPVDPSITTGPITDCTSAYATGYTIKKDSTTNRITVSAITTDLSASISITR